MIYADNAATTKLDTDAFEAMKPFLLGEYGNASGIYSFSRVPKRALKDAREIIAQCIHASPEEIYFTSGGTESDNWAVKIIAGSDEKKRTVITSAIEHHAILNSCRVMEGRGYSVVYMTPDKDGIIASEILKRHITDTVSLITVMSANNELGTIQPIRELSNLAHEHDAVFHTDAVQAIGHIDINVDEMGIDMLSASAHKFNGPKGVGFLYIRKGTNVSPYLDGGSQESGLRAGTENVPGIVGMAVALKSNIENLKTNRDYVRKLERHLLEKLSDFNVSYVRNGGENTLPGLISLSFDGRDGEAILHRLDLMGISIATGSACNSHSKEISHVLKAINLPESLAKGTVRISLGKNNTEQDVDAIADGLKKILFHNRN